MFLKSIKLIPEIEGQITAYISHLASLNHRDFLTQQSLHFLVEEYDQHF